MFTNSLKSLFHFEKSFFPLSLLLVLFLSASCSDFDANNPQNLSLSGGSLNSSFDNSQANKINITNLKAEVNDKSQVVISWAQNISGSGQVYFGTLENELNQASAKEANDLSFHRQIFANVPFEVNRKYYFQARTIVGGKTYKSSIVSLVYETHSATNDDSNNIATGDIASHCDQSKPLCGIMYGVAISGGSYGHTAKYNYSATMRIQAEKTGVITGFLYHNRTYIKSEWDRDDGKGYNTKFRCRNSDSQCKMSVMSRGGYNMGNGGLLGFAIHEDDGKGSPIAQPLAKGTRTFIPTGEGHYVGTYQGMKYYVGGSNYQSHIKVNWDKPVRLTTGKYYHLVIRQLQPNKGSVVLNGFFAHGGVGITPESAPGGPYYGRRMAVFIKGKATDSWKTRINVFPDFKLYYTDGVVAGTGNDGVGGTEASFSVSGNRMTRQVFTMDYTAQMSGLWVRYHRKSGNSPLTITVKNADGSVVTRVLSMASKTPKAVSNQYGGTVNWVYNRFSAPISLMKGRKYYVEFKTDSSTTYQVLTEETYDLRGGYKLSKESVWKGSQDRAEYSVRGENGFVPASRSVKDLTLLFTVSGKPEVVR